MPPPSTGRASRTGQSSSVAGRKRSSSCTDASLPRKRTCSSSPLKGRRATADRVYRRVIVEDYACSARRLRSITRHRHPDSFDDVSPTTIPLAVSKSDTRECYIQNLGGVRKRDPENGRLPGLKTGNRNLLRLRWNR
ncbi:hypothetical protein K458DRAFT_162131 [Lentithecium fluviatile CBS 122367]|uniref:Uncharacterized protein n=1 Tax=Lentithecium fluviatile CBS 122367 TaxID=1168545 RepID=A0A6G1IGM9_9PLEO|nr:hypothetical protein K458DRAFT_162131 [Lentithecium fluviatile CBS 122367]